MRTIFATLLLVLTFAQISYGQTLVSIPRDGVVSDKPVPVMIELLEHERTNFAISIKNGNKEVNTILVSGNINIDKLGSRFLAVSKNISITTSLKNRKPTEEKIEIQLNTPAIEPENLEEEVVLIGGIQHIFKKNNPTLISKLDKNKFRFFVQSAQSKNSYVKKVVIELLNSNNQKSLIVINSTNLWWQPYFSIEGDFELATVKEVSFK